MSTTFLQKSYKLMDRDSFVFYVAASTPTEAVRIAVKQWPSLDKTTFISVQECHSIAVEVRT